MASITLTLIKKWGCSKIVSKKNKLWCDLRRCQYLAMHWIRKHGELPTEVLHHAL